MQIFTKKAFTMMEIISVITIIGLITVFAVPKYTQTVEKSYQQEAITQLTTIHAAQEYYKAQTGSYWPSSGSQSLTSINSNLGLSILAADNLTYQCSGTGTTYSCTAGRATFTVTLTEAILSSTNPGCTGSC